MIRFCVLKLLKVSLTSVLLYPTRLSPRHESRLARVERGYAKRLESVRTLFFVLFFMRL